MKGQGWGIIDISMTKRTRTILFFTCIFLFLIVAPLVVLYSQGYRFDFSPPAGGKIFVQTGAFYFKVLPNSAEIYLDGKLKKKTDFFFGTVFIKNLLPKKYTIEIKKDSYLSWSKTIELKENEVQEFKDIALIPANPDFSILTKKVDDFFFSPDKKEMILKKTGEQGWYLTSFDLEKKVESVLIEEKKLSQKGASFSSLEWSPDSKKVVLKAGVNEQERYFLLELDKSFPLSPISLDFLIGLEKISFNPQNPQKLFFIANGDLLEADYKTKTISGPILSDVITYEIFNGAVFSLDSLGFLTTSDFSGKTKEKINSEPFPLKGEVQYQIFVSPTNVLLLEDDTLFFLDKTSKIFKQISRPVKEVKFSDDFKKAVYSSDSEIWILYLEDILEQPSKKAGQSQLTARFSEKIGGVFWLTNHYLIFNIGSQVKIAEIDDRDKVQIWDFSESKEPKIFFNQTDKKLYLLSDGNLDTSAALIK